MRPFALTLLLAFAAPESSVPAPRTFVHHRGLFDLIRPRDAYARACRGRAPLSVETHRTSRDIAAAVFTGFLYTPAHVTVICPR